MGSISAFYTMPHPPIVIPEIGRGEEKKIRATFDAFDKAAAEIASLDADTIIIVTPHGPVFSDAVALTYDNSIKGTLGKFSAPQVAFKEEIDIYLTEKIIEMAEEEGIMTAEITKNSAKRYGIGYELDHGAMVPLYFINKKLSGYKLVHITYGMLPKIQLYKFGMCIRKAVEESDSKAVFIASGDLSHKLRAEGPYGYTSEGEAFDREIISLLQAGDVQGVFNMDCNIVEKAAECGLRSYYIMLGAMDGYNIKGHLLSYEGTFGVGYGVMSFSLEASDTDMYNALLESGKRRFSEKINNSDPYVRLARESLTHYLLYDKYIDYRPAYVTEEMKNTKRGVFVSLKKEGQLRGCIGTIFPVTENIAEEIIRNAVEAGTQDPRFSPVAEAELEEIDFSVDVLTEAQKASKEELDPQKYGVIVRWRGRTGLLLPDLEGVDTVEEQLDIALRKAGIPNGADYSIEKFEVIRHKE
ncbi:AmmeMemoRadiSam system protein A [Lutispora saccharofermentans]|uniref:AmmeMemoRadiSam system protein A n=1 Tax=Lutispora saccharofermentans TaxID=3024236 RepID=A0ABT1NBH3_9FIRM|nr:AmmeMemoRadiSam system protein A [Lutispora saccharofermentans]MCQ1528615.1 AmmeMemoRadiSam system protein A [Lutispora saccharofermentans]